MPFMPRFAGQLRARLTAASATDDQLEALGPLKQLVGTWQSLPGHGWNVIALPYAAQPKDNFGFNYRVLCNQYDETLSFTKVGTDVPNRGIDGEATGTATDADQTLAVLDYDQEVTQILAADFPDSGKAGDPDLAIHHEAGLWLYLTDQQTKGLNIARMATVPHGDAVLALGTAATIDGPPTIPDGRGLPLGITDVLGKDAYLDPYNFFHEQPFAGVFDPTVPNALLRNAVPGDVVKTTVLPVDSTVESGGITNIPFVVKQANATEVTSTFWIQETADGSLFLQYTQTVMLEFFPRNDGQAGLIKWPHVSINTLKKITG